MKESIDTWRKQEFIQQYFEQLKLQSFNSTLSESLITIHDLDNKYAILLRTEDILTDHDSEMLESYIVQTLEDEGYIITYSSEDFISLQASTKRRVSGIQMFGNIKIIKMQQELQILVTPYNDRQYENPRPKSELISVLFQ